jgi:hypothetical protein
VGRGPAQNDGANTTAVYGPFAVTAVKQKGGRIRVIGLRQQDMPDVYATGAYDVVLQEQVGCHPRGQLSAPNAKTCCATVAL